MKKLISAALSLTLLLALVTGCTRQVVVVVSPAPSEAPQAQTPVESAAPAPVPAEGAVKTGLSMVTGVSSSKDATAEADGTAQTDIALVAVTVDDDGVITGCVIDAIQAKIAFSNEGRITTDLATEFASKNELGEAYGMKKASSIGKEWNEQAAAMAQYAVGKTVEELKGIAVNESGAPTDADLASSVTLYIGSFVSGIEAAVNNAAHLGAQAGDKLALTSVTTMAKSKDASADAEGQAQAYATVGVVTLNGDTITSCYIDAVQANVNFDAKGAITTDLTAPIASKNELGDAYGMRGASSIGKEWNEQAAGFSAYVTGKTVSEVAGIAVSESGAPADADLAASVTVGIGDFQALIEKAAD